MKLKRNICKSLLFITILTISVITITPHLNTKDNNLTIKNVEALGFLEKDDILKVCHYADGMCYIQGIEYWGVVYTWKE